MPSSRRTRWAWSSTSSPAAGTSRRVSAETASRYPTPAASTTTWLDRRRITGPRTEAIIAYGFCASRRTPSGEGTTQACAVGVTDRHREGIGGVVGLRRLAQRQQRPHHSLNLLLGRRARSADGLLDRLRRVGEAGDAGD